MLYISQSSKAKLDCSFVIFPDRVVWKGEKVPEKQLSMENMAQAVLSGDREQYIKIKGGGSSSSVSFRQVKAGSAKKIQDAILAAKCSRSFARSRADHDDPKLTSLKNIGSEYRFRNARTPQLLTELYVHVLWLHSSLRSIIMCNLLKQEGETQNIIRPSDVDMWKETGLILPPRIKI